MDKIYNVRIANMELSLYSSESQEYTETITADVNERIQAIIGDNLSVSLITAALLTSMDLCDEVHKLREGTENLRKQLKSYMDETSKAIIERDEARRLAEKYKNELLTLKIELSNQKDDKA